MYLKQSSVTRFLGSVGGKFFTIEFKKLDGTRRKLTGRLGVVADLVGGESTTKHIPEIQVIYTSDGKRKCFYKNRVFNIKCGDKVLKPKRAKVR